MTTIERGIGIGCAFSCALIVRWVITGSSPFVLLANIGIWLEAVRVQFIASLFLAYADFRQNIGATRREVAGMVSDEVAGRTLIK